MQKSKSSKLLIIGLLALFFIKKKKGSIIIENPIPQKSPDADYLVFLKNKSKLYNSNKVAIGETSGDSYVDGFNTNELPLWLKVRNGTQKYYVSNIDFKIIT